VEFGAEVGVAGSVEAVASWQAIFCCLQFLSILLSTFYNENVKDVIFIDSFKNDSDYDF